ncbi:MAG: efflux RND transporter periplasmic adaptor subunit [Thermodesulfobacteriota bacterium]
MRPCRPLLVWLLLPVLGLAACGPHPEASPPVRRPQVTGVTVATLVPAPLPRHAQVTGTVQAPRTVTVASQILATVVALATDEGQTVRAGQTLIRLDDRQLAAALREAEAAVAAARQEGLTAQRSLELAELTHDRYARLATQGAVAIQALDELATARSKADLERQRAAAALTQAEAHLAGLTVQLGHTVITAPETGVVTRRFTSTGSLATPGSPLLVIEPASGLEVEAAAGELLLPRLAPGSPVEVQLPALALTIPTTVAAVVPAVDPASRTFRLRIPVAAPGVVSGLFAVVRIPLGEKPALLVPQAAVAHRGALTGVFAVDDHGLVSFRLVRLGEAAGDQVEILSGLAAGERIITAGLEKAQDGGQLAEPLP